MIQNWHRMTPTKIASLASDTIGAEDGPCAEWHALPFPTWPPQWDGPCRDSVDLARMAEQVAALDAAFGALSLSVEEQAQWAAFKVEWEAWRLEMAEGDYTYTTIAEQVNEFDSWTGRIQGWRDWYEARSGGSAPGPTPLPPEQKGNGVFGGLSDVLSNAGTLVMLGIVGLVVWQVTRR